MNILDTKVSVLPLEYLHENKGQIEGVPANPRILRDARYKALLESLRADDLTGVLPLKIYKHEGEFVVLGGNMRLKALRELKGNDYAVSCVVIPEDAPVEVLRKIVVLDNSTFGEWDFDMLANEWNADELGDWGIDLPAIKDLNGLLDEANFESLNDAAREGTGCEQITFVFSKEQADIVNAYIKTNGKDTLIPKIVELCQ